MRTTTRFHIPSIAGFGLIFTLISCGKPGTEAPRPGEIEVVQMAHSTSGQSSTGGDDQSRQKLTPLVDCVAKRGDHRIAIFGFSNSSSKILIVPPGGHNHLAPAEKTVELPSMFLPGVKHNVFSVAFKNRQVAWKLGNRHVVADDRSPVCPEEACATDPAAQLHGDQIEATARAVFTETERMRVEIKQREDDLADLIASEEPSPERFRELRAELAAKTLTLLQLTDPRSGAVAAPEASPTAGGGRP